MTKRRSESQIVAILKEADAGMPASELCRKHAIDMNTIESQPLYNPVSHIVYAANRNQISNVWVAGKPLMKDRKLTTVEIDKILSTTEVWQKKIQGDGVGSGLLIKQDFYFPTVFFKQLIELSIYLINSTFRVKKIAS